MYGLSTLTSALIFLWRKYVYGGIMRLAVSLACKGETAERIASEASNMMINRFHLLARVK